MEREHFTDAKAKCIGPENKIFSPSFPSTCPYVTSVGGTYIAPGKTVYDPEIAVIMGGSTASTAGGGFSSVFARPEYQKDKVDEYFTDHDPGYISFNGLVPNATNTTLRDIISLAGNTGGR